MPEKQPRAEAPTAVQVSMMLWRDLPATLGRTAIQTWTAMGAEAIRFASERMRKDVETQQALLRCRSLEELRTVQAAYLQSAGSQYADEAGRMLNLMREATLAGLAAAVKARGYDDVPL